MRVCVCVRMCVCVLVTLAASLRPPVPLTAPESVQVLVQNGTLAEVHWEPVPPMSVRGQLHGYKVPSWNSWLPLIDSRLAVIISEHLTEVMIFLLQFTARVNMRTLCSACTICVFVCLLPNSLLL